MTTSAVSIPMPSIPRRRRSPEDVLAAAPVSGPKKVLLAAPRGYCAGVDRAVIAVEKALEHYGPPVYVRKQIVHNVHVVSSLEEKGAIFVDETDEVPEGALVIFSAHGVSPAVVQSAEDRGLRTIDATCPLVTKVHREAVRFAKDDFDILLIGHDGHEEVEGTAGEAPEHIQIINGPHEVDKVTVRDPEKVIWLSQTTLSVDETMETVRLLKERFPTLQDPPSDDICYATTNRQVAIKKISPQADLVIVVGSANSSNSVRLVEVALEYGAKASYRVDFANEVDEAWFEGVATVGRHLRCIRSGSAGQGRASAPGGLRLRRRGGSGHSRGRPALLPAQGAPGDAEEIRRRDPRPGRTQGAGLTRPRVLSLAARTTRLIPPDWSSGAATERGVTSIAGGVVSPSASRALSFRAVGRTRASSVPTIEL